LRFLAAYTEYVKPCMVEGSVYSGSPFRSSGFHLCPGDICEKFLQTQDESMSRETICFILWSVFQRAQKYCFTMWSHNILRAECGRGPVRT